MKHNRAGRRGFGLTDFLIAVAVIAVLGAIAVPRLGAKKALAVQDSASDAAIIAALREIRSAEVTYQLRNGEYADLMTLRSANLVEENLAGGGRSGYRFVVQQDEPGHYVLTASPLLPVAGSHFYYSDDVGLIFESATVSSTPVGNMNGQAPAGFVAVGR